MLVETYVWIIIVAGYCAFCMLGLSTDLEAKKNIKNVIGRQPLSKLHWLARLLDYVMMFTIGFLIPFMFFWTGLKRFLSEEKFIKIYTMSMIQIYSDASLFTNNEIQKLQEYINKELAVNNGRSD